jgi:hypothetical protein
MQNAAERAPHLPSIAPSRRLSQPTARLESDHHRTIFRPIRLFVEQRLDRIELARVEETLVRSDGMAVPDRLLFLYPRASRCGFSSNLLLHAGSQRARPPSLGNKSLDSHIKRD